MLFSNRLQNYNLFFEHVFEYAIFYNIICKCSVFFTKSTNILKKIH